MVPNSEMISRCLRRLMYSPNAALTASFLVRWQPSFWASWIRRSSMARLVGSLHILLHIALCMSVMLTDLGFCCCRFALPSYYRFVATREGRVPVGTAFHERPLALCESLSYAECSGYYPVSVS